MTVPTEVLGLVFGGNDRQIYACPLFLIRWRSAGFLSVGLRPIPRFERPEIPAKLP